MQSVMDTVFGTGFDKTDVPDLAGRVSVAE